MLIVHLFLIIQNSSTTLSLFIKNSILMNSLLTVNSSLLAA
jgi:hypothetical protein